MQPCPELIIINECVYFTDAGHLLGTSLLLLLLFFSQYYIVQHYYPLIFTLIAWTGPEKSILLQLPVLIRHVDLNDGRSI